jgi:CHASE3 domain sensor protein
MTEETRTLSKQEMMQEIIQRICTLIENSLDAGDEILISENNGRLKKIEAKAKEEMTTQEKIALVESWGYDVIYPKLKLVV